MIRHGTQVGILDLMSELDLIQFQEPEIGITEIWQPQTAEGQEILNSLIQPEIREQLRAWYQRVSGIKLNIVAAQIKRTLEHLTNEKF